MLFNYVFSDSSAKRTTYKFGLVKSILDNLFNSEGEDYSLFISYENLFGKFSENYWNLVTKYHLRQMLPDGKSEYSKIEQIFMALIQEEPAFANIPFTSIRGMEYVKVIPTRNDALRKLNSAFVQNQFKTYKPQLISTEIRSKRRICGVKN
jgi:hypothetical protein